MTLKFFVCHHLQKIQKLRENKFQQSSLNADHLFILITDDIFNLEFKLLAG